MVDTEKKPTLPTLWAAVDMMKTQVRNAYPRGTGAFINIIETRWYAHLMHPLHKAAEMARKQALFLSDSELQQLLHIFRLLGTPTEELWPGVNGLKDWHEYPQWKPQNLACSVPSLEPDGVDILSKMLQYDPANRISAKKALDHPYFDSLNKSQF